MKKIYLLFIFAIFVGALIPYTLEAREKKNPVSADKNITMISLFKTKADPEVIAVKKGEYVQFNSKDGRSHNLSQGSGNGREQKHSHSAGGLESGVFNKDEAYKLQFTKNGVYNFHDHLNPNVFITVIVYEEGKN